MGWFTKKESDKKEDIQTLPELPELNVELDSPPIRKKENSTIELPNLENSTLPSLPNPAILHKSSQEMIKSEITKPKNQMQRSRFNIEPIQEEYHEEEMKRMKGYNLPRTVEINQGIDYIKPSTKKAEPVYIRLDKFETTIQTFDEIKNKIIEIEELLKRTREIKEKEEKELEEWEKEIQIIKSRIDSIDKNVFSQLD